MSVHSSKIRTKWNSATTAKIRPATKSTNDKLSREEIDLLAGGEWDVVMKRGAGALPSVCREVAKQLSDTMRENERLKYLNATWVKKLEEMGVCFTTEDSNKDSDNG